MQVLLSVLALVALASAAPQKADIFSGNQFFTPAAPEAVVENQFVATSVVTGDSVTVVHLPSHGKSAEHKSEQVPVHQEEKPEHEAPEKKPGQPDKPEHAQGPKQHPARPIRQKCGKDEKFYDDGNGVQYHFPSAGNVPKLGYTYRPEGNKKAQSYSIAFSKLFFKEWTNSTDREKLTTVSLNSFKWSWDNCDMMELEEIPGTVYFVLHGYNEQKCIQGEIYVTFSVDTNTSTSILKVITTFSNAPICKGRRSFSEMLRSWNTVGVQFNYMCHDFGPDREHPKCEVDEVLEDRNSLSETLTYNSSQISQQISTYKACWGERADWQDATMEADNQTCFTPGEEPAGAIHRFGFGWPIDSDGGPRNAAAFRMEAGYDPEHVTDNTVVSLDPFSFRFEPTAVASPVFPYTPSVLEETSGRVTEPVAEIPTLEFPVDELEEEVALDPLAEESSNALNDQGLALEGHTITQEIVYDTTYRDASLIALVAFLVVSLVLTFFLARKSETPSV